MVGILKSARRKPQPPQSNSETLSFAAEIPVGESQPLWKIELQMHSEPQADGERLRLRAHLQTNLGSALRPALQAGKTQPPPHDALPHEAAAKPARGMRLAQRTGAAVQELSRRALAVPLLRRLAEPLLQLDFNTWIEIQASTASLDAGASSLLPQSERLAALGIRPRAAGEQPVTETWAGKTPDGVAQLSVLQIERRHLPKQLQKLLHDKPFGLAATIVNTMQQKR